MDKIKLVQDGTTFRAVVVTVIKLRVCYDWEISSPPKLLSASHE